MYSACLFCHGRLGANAVVEECPVGRRLAFDPARGRLWVICARCDRWNLTPFETRLDAIERCEGLYRGARVRASTDNIGLAHASGGLTLVRVGRPERRELAAWRYGRELARRLRRTAVLAGVATVAGGAALATGVLSAGTAALLVPMFLPALGPFAHLAVGLHGSIRQVRVQSADGRTLEVFPGEFEQLQLVPDGAGWALALKHGYGTATLRGEVAARALGPLAARVNRAGARRHTALDAAERIAAHGGPEPLLAHLARVSQERAGDYEQRRRSWERGDDLERLGLARASNVRNAGALHRLAPAERLAVEMALHEATERRALEEELAPLEAAWRDAEQIAAIADSLAVPAVIERRLAALRGRAR